MFFNSIPSISARDSWNALRKPNTILIDVRTKPEYKSGHAAGARNIPLDTLDDAQVTALVPYDGVYVICQSGGRSSMAVGILKKAGVKAINVSGGTLAWRNEELPLE